MKKNHIVIIRIFIWLIPMAILFGFAYNYFSFSGHFHLKYDFGKQSGFVSRFFMPEDYEMIVEENDSYMKIINSPIAFNLRMPVKFENAKVKLTYSSENLQNFEFGIIEDEGKKIFLNENIEIEKQDQWQTKEIEFDLKDIFFHPTEGYSFVIVIPNNSLKITEIEFDLFGQNIWEKLGRKLSRTDN